MRVLVRAASQSVAGGGPVGPGGPRTGNSSGVLPGNSSGRGGSPGSRTGGGISGLGLPGGIPGGASPGVPGVVGGISGGSIGIYIKTLRVLPRSGRATVIDRSIGACCDNRPCAAMFLFDAAGTHPGVWQTASMWPSGSRTNAPY